LNPLILWNIKLKRQLQMMKKDYELLSKNECYACHQHATKINYWVPFFPYYKPVCDKCDPTNFHEPIELNNHDQFIQKINKAVNRDEDT
jgi:hypothetical protein